MSALKFPYTMHCPKCKAKLKIKSPELVGTRMPCPKCKAKIDVVTPDEDGLVPYGIEAAPPPEPDPEPTEEELDEIDREERKKRAEKNWKNFKWIASVFTYIAILAGVGVGLWYFVFKDYNERLVKKEKDGNDPDNFGKLFKVD